MDRFEFTPLLSPLMDTPSRLDVRAVPAGLAVAGEVDAYTAPTLNAEIAAFLRDHRTLHLDLADVEFMDSSGLGVLVAARRLADERAGHLVIESPSPPVERLLALSGLRSYLTVVPARES